MNEQSCSIFSHPILTAVVRRGGLPAAVLMLIGPVVVADEQLRFSPPSFIVPGDGVVANKVVLLNNGEGVFDQTLPFTAGADTIAIALGDLDGDGDLDVVTALSGVFVHLNNGNATFAPPIALNASNVTAVAIADVNADRLQDVIVARSSASVNLAIVFLNTGSPFGGEAFAQSSYVIDSLVRDIAVGDLDGDGDLDVATLHPTSRRKTR